MKATRAAGIAAALASGYALEKWLMRRERSRPDEAASEDFAPPPDEEHVNLELPDGSRIHLVDRGDGPPILLLHGVTLSTLTWHYQLRDLAENHRVIALDHRGHGRSTGDAGSFTIEQLADDVAHLIEALDLRDLVIVGHSMGGMILMQMATDRPELLADRVAGLIFMGTDAGPGKALPGWEIAVRAISPTSQRGIKLAGRLPGGLLPSTDLAYLLTRWGFGAAPSPTHVELTRTMTGAVPPAVVAEFWASILTFDARQAMRSVEVPSLVLVGSRDFLTPVRQARELAANLPGGELEVTPGAGHMLMLERHAEISDRIARFAKDVQ